jgi:hypothetical protein
MDTILDMALRYRAFGGAISSSTVWTIANGLYGDPDNSTDSTKTVLNGGIIVRFGRGSSQTGEGDTTVEIITEDSSSVGKSDL